MARLGGRRVGALVAANLVAGGVLALLVAGNASAQRGMDVRARGDYTMVAGKTRAGSIPAVYIIDSANQELVALRWDQTDQAMVGIGYRSIASDARAARGR